MRGRAALITCTCFGNRSLRTAENPVKFFPGRARFSARPWRTGSTDTAATTGTVVVSSRNASSGAPIDHQLERARLLERQLAGVRALQDLVDQLRRAAVVLAEIRPVAQEPAELGIFAARVGGHDALLDAALGDLAKMLDEERIAEDEERLGFLLRHLGERGIELGGGAHLHRVHAHA